MIRGYNSQGVAGATALRMGIGATLGFGTRYALYEPNAERTYRGTGLLHFPQPRTLEAL